MTNDNQQNPGQNQPVNPEQPAAPSGAGGAQQPPQGWGPPPQGMPQQQNAQQGAQQGQQQGMPPQGQWGYPPQGWGPPPQGMPQQGMPPQGQWGYPPQGWGPPPQGMPQGPQAPVQPIGSFGRDDAFSTTIKIPENNLKFDDNKFLKLLAGSISLTKDEKRRVIEAVPKLTQAQIDELIKILEEEKRKFSELDVKHKDQLKMLEAQHKAEWEALEAEMMSEETAEEEKNQADEIRKSLGSNTPKKEEE